MSQMIDVSPLAAPVNACRWNAAQLRQTAKTQALPAEQKARVLQSADWLDQIGQRVLFRHTNPVILMAVGNLALSIKDRGEVLAALQQIEAITVEATSTTWAKVED